jgi:multidrug efflux pump
MYVGLLGLTAYQFDQTPTGYVPGQDKQYLVAFAQLPDAASLERTDAVIREMSEIALAQPGVEHSVAFPGLSINGFTNSPNSGIVFTPLADFDERQDPSLSANAIAGQLNQKFASIPDAFIAIFPPPPVQGLGTIGGFRLQIQDRANHGYEALYGVTQQVIMKAWAHPALTGVFSSYQVNVPQLDLDVDRTKALKQDLSLDDVFSTLQSYMGSTYVNDINRFGRTYQVNVQADEEFRQTPEQIRQLEVRNANGEMIPLGAFVDVNYSVGPDRVMHYNAYTTAEINGSPMPGFSSGEAQAAIEQILAETLPIGMTYEWTELTYQQKLAGDTAMLIYPLVILLVFLVLAAQYESVRLPMAIILIIPMTLLSAISGVILWGSDNNIFTQIGLIVLVGLATKNAILIVEFAKELQDKGRTVMEAVLEASRLRLRPILMTSIAFIMGVVPMVFSTGAGAEMRQAMGIAVFSGMIGVTIFGLLLTPLFYYVLAKRTPKEQSDNTEQVVLEPINESTV